MSDSRSSMLWENHAMHLCIDDRTWFYSTYSIYHYIHTMYYTCSCILSNRNRFKLRDFNCIVQGSLYYNMYIGIMSRCALVSCTPSQCVGLVFGCALFVCWVSLCVPFFIISLLECYTIMKVANIIVFFMAILLILIYIFGLSVTR